MFPNLSFANINKYQSGPDINSVPLSVGVVIVVFAFVNVPYKSSTPSVVSFVIASSNLSANVDSLTTFCSVVNDSSFTHLYWKVVVSSPAKPTSTILTSAVGVRLQSSPSSDVVISIVGALLSNLYGSVFSPNTWYIVESAVWLSSVWSDVTIVAPFTVICASVFTVAFPALS